MIRFKRVLAILLSTCMIGGMMPLSVSAEETDSGIAVQANDSAGKTEQQSTDEASVTINGETLYYATLEEAFSAADGKTATITMLNDAECTVTSGSPISVMNKSNITLNMNGKTLSGHGTGDCGIITLATGSLSVQGPGTMKSTFKCLSCQSKNAKMTVDNITFDVSEADYGVWVVSSNTVTLNNIQIIGKAKTSAVYQYSNSANVTINNMNAIEAGYSDVVYKGGTLKINGGTFDKISVTSNNTGGITSVSQVLGEGCIYRYADKTWETSELSNTLEISNVTVEKIPLTINPEAEATSWHNNSAEHSLHMNAEPTTAGNDITYEWYDGDTKLECDSDTYTIPKIMSVGNHTYTCKATCDGYTLSHEFTFIVEEEECKHEGVEITFKNNGFGNCPKCNATVYQPAVETTDKYDIDDDGTKDTVYEISNAGQLYWFAALVNGTLTGVEQDTSANGFLTENITVNKNVLDESGNLVNDTSTFRKWIPIGGYYNEDIVYYAGKFDGNSKTISGLYDSDSSNMDTGMFGSIGENSKVSDVGIVDSSFNAMATAGGICGSNNGTIENCYSSSSVTAAYAGGVCGSNMGEILKCYNTGNVANGTYSIDNYSYAGGICGSNDGTGGKVESSYNSGNINGTGYIGGVCGANGIYYKTIITNCYNIGIVSGSGEDTGGVCGFNCGYTANSYNAGTVSGTGKYIGSVCGLNNSIVTTCYSLKADVSLSEVGGKGASATAYKVQTKTAEQFSNGEIAYLLNGSDDTFTWRQSLDSDKLPVLDETHAKVYASVPCHANFSNSKEKLSTLEHRFKDGVCEVCGEQDVPEQINGVYQLGTENNLYWFAEQVNSGKTSLNAVLTKNITVNTEELSEASSNAKSWIPIGNINAKYTGTFNGNGYTISGLYCNDNFNGPIGLFGYIEDKGCVSNVGLENVYFSGKGNEVGGICGINYGKIENCYTSGTTNSENGWVGGVCGQNLGTISNCYSLSNPNVAAICGRNHSTISNCYYNTDVNIKGAIEYNPNPQATVDKVEGKTATQFKSGEVAFLLQAEQTENIWGQRLGEDGDTYPVLDSTKRVYQVDKYDGCEGKPGSSTKVYSNQSTSIYEEHSFAYELVENGNAIKATCSECGATYTVKLTQPAATSDEKIVYNGTEKKAGTAIDSGNTGIETIPENAITYAVVTNGTPSTYSTTAPKNAGKYKAKLTLGTGNNIVSIEINFTIAKAAKAPSMPGAAMAPARSTAKVGDIKLPNGWNWQEADKDTALADDVAVTATAVYTGADKGNYETESVIITITRSICDHKHTEIRNRQEATCTQTGYTGDTYCTDCDKLLNIGKELAALGHDYKANVTKQPTTTEEGVRTYTCTRCNSSYTESIAKLPEEQHTYNYTESISASGHSYTQPIAKIKADDSSRNQGRDNGNANQNLKSDATNETENRNTNSEHNKSGISNENENGQSNTEQKKADTEVKPYIKDDSGKEGWDVIKPQLEEAKSGDTVTVTMNGTTVVPKDVIESIKGKDTILVLNMGNGLSWKINGKNITAPAGDIDFGVTIGADAGKTIPVDVINNVTGKRSFMNLTLAYDGEFGFTATLIVNMETKNAGLYANLFYYNEQLGKLEFVSAGQIDSYGNVEIAFTHASDYAIVIDAAVMDGEKVYACNSAIIIIIGICILLIVFGTVIFVRKKSGSEEE